MGYYSSVAIRLSPEGAIAFAKAVEALDTLKDEIKEDLSRNEDNEDGAYHWSETKWYDPASDAIMAILATLPVKDFWFLRLGEEPGDKETYGEFQHEVEFDGLSYARCKGCDEYIPHSTMGNHNHEFVFDK